MADYIEVTREEDEAFEQMLQKRIDQLEEDKARLAAENAKLWAENERLQKGEAA